jgi:pyridoxamine 5'-phosphate oxidase
MNATQRDPDTVGGPGRPPAATGPDSLSSAAGGLSSLTEETLAGDPMTQFAAWMADAEARGLPEPTAMVLATVSAEGRPRARTVLLKGHGQPGFTFYTNRTSRKGQDLAANGRACAVFPWFAMGRQVTAEGDVRIMSQAESEPYYRSRPRQSQLGAWASRQSQVLGSRAELDDRVAELERRWPPPAETPSGLRPPGDIPMPDFWGGYVLVPQTVEFWQAGTFRLHDRLRYRRHGAGWVIERISP